MKLDAFLKKIKDKPTEIEFDETMAIIDAYYTFEPTAFTNGGLGNDVGQNSGSCKLFAFAKDQGLTKEQTLACFGRYYFDDVLKNPEGTGHQNIRNFMKTGFEGLVFECNPLNKK